MHCTVCKIHTYKFQMITQFGKVDVLCYIFVGKRTTNCKCMYAMRKLQLMVINLLCDIIVIQSGFS